MSQLSLILLTALATLALYFIHLIHVYPTKKLERIRKLVLRLDELVGEHLFGSLTVEDDQELIRILNDLRDLTDD